MKVILHDLDIQYHEILTGKCDEVIYADGKYAPCHGCFGCWTKHPAECFMKDSLKQTSRVIGQADEFVIITENLYGTYSPAVKNALDRCIGISTPLSTYRGKQMHHTLRYGKHGLLIVFVNLLVVENNLPLVCKIFYANNVEVLATLRGNSRTYSVIRVHDGETTVLPDLDSDPNTVTIKTDKFSTYALTYHEDAASSMPSGSGSGGSGGRPGPSTPTASNGNNNSNSNSSDTASSGNGTSSGDENSSIGDNGSDSNSSDTTSSGNDTSSGDGNSSSGDNGSDNSGSDTTSSENDTSSGDENSSSEDNSSDSSGSDTTSSGNDTSSGDGNSSSGDNGSDNSGSDTTSNSVVSTSDESTHTPNDGSPSESNDNPATGIAVSLVPMAAAFTFLTITVKRKKK